jgi:hypothetical protein
VHLAGAPSERRRAGQVTAFEGGVERRRLRSVAAFLAVELFLRVGARGSRRNPFRSYRLSAFSFRLAES